MSGMQQGHMRLVRQARDPAHGPRATAAWSSSRAVAARRRRERGPMSGLVQVRNASNVECYERWTWQCGLIELVGYGESGGDLLGSVGRTCDVLFASAELV